MWSIQSLSGRLFSSLHVKFQVIRDSVQVVLKFRVRVYSSYSCFCHSHQKLYFFSSLGFSLVFAPLRLLLFFGIHTNQPQ